jgi:hypothetical protein
MATEILADGLIDLSVDFMNLRLKEALANPSDELIERLGADNLAQAVEMLGGAANVAVPRIWEGSPPEEIPYGATYKEFYPCIIITHITPVFDIFAMVDTAGENVLGTMRNEVKAIGEGTGFRGLRPLKQFIYAVLEGCEGLDMEGGSVGSCSIFREWPRTQEPTEGGTNYYHSGYWFDVTAQRGELA